jgi:nitrite reductase/ring-hydroxylating ferredoxin subunit/uncharacterized membrane protein
MTKEMTMGLRDLLAPMESLDALDPVGEWLGGQVAQLVERSSMKSLLSGTWLGHPVHPVLTDVPIGLFTGATLADLFGAADSSGAADLLTVLGLLSVVPTAATGLSDWADTVGAEKRLGLLHALANAGGTVLFAAALLSRRGGNRRLGRLFGIAGLGALSVGGYIGGDLVFARGVGVDHTVFDEPPSDWTRVARDEQIPEGTPTLVSAAGYGLLLHRSGGEIRALADRCTHAGGPLHEGEVDEELCVTCPWHGSRFRLADGAVVRGPATAPQPAFEVRVSDGNVEVRPRQDQ